MSVRPWFWIDEEHRPAGVEPCWFFLNITVNEGEGAYMIIQAAHWHERFNRGTRFDPGRSVRWCKSRTCEPRIANEPPMHFLPMTARARQTLDAVRAADLLARAQIT